MANSNRKVSYFYNGSVLNFNFFDILKNILLNYDRKYILKNHHTLNYLNYI